MNTLNDKPFEYHSRNGTQFNAARCDFRGGVDVKVFKHSSQTAVLQDFVEMAAYHALHIHSQLNGFQGYDCVPFRIEKI
jgi:hypothetical protein